MRALVACAVVAATTVRAWGYGEDVPTDNHSTAHYDMALALARCAGFSADDARTIAEADEVTDTLAYGAVAFSFTDRNGPNRAYFHFPEAGGSVNGVGDGPLRSWARGETTLTDSTGATISICDAAGTCCDAAGSCVAAGSPQAIGIWLHAVADYWSHHACIESGGSDHTDYDTSDPAQTAYCESTMHSHEWGARVATGFNATLQANALEGLHAMRSVLASHAADHGMTACVAITDDELLGFASATSSALRVAAASSLYAACDAVRSCGEPAGGDAGGGDNAAPVDAATSSGCGCAGGGGDGGSVVVLIAVMAASARSRRRHTRPRRSRGSGTPCP